MSLAGPCPSSWTADALLLFLLSANSVSSSASSSSAILALPADELSVFLTASFSKGLKKRREADPFPPLLPFLPFPGLSSFLQERALEQSQEDVFVLIDKIFIAGELVLDPEAFILINFAM